MFYSSAAMTECLDHFFKIYSVSVGFILFLIHISSRNPISFDKELPGRESY